MTHACELETSMVLGLRPELVDLNAACGADRAVRFAFYAPTHGARAG